jgi:hypothetical protein
VLGLKADYTFAGFLTKMWELLAKKKVSFLPEYAKPGMLCFPVYLFKLYMLTDGDISLLPTLLR